MGMLAGQDLGEKPFDACLDVVANGSDGIEALFGHLRAPGIMHADEEHGGLVGHGVMSP